jgi:hypothetical protein
MCRFKWFTVEAKRPALAANGMIIVFAFLSALTPQFACAQGNGRGNGRGNGNSFQQHGKGSQASENQSNRQSGARGYNSIGGTLTPAQVGQLVRMREEEKLAHDVYVTLAQSSGLHGGTKRRGRDETAGTEHINNDQNGFEFATKFL